jgi:mannose-6-phosphate isomerase-like protein (cupin superfamily)
MTYPPPVYHGESGEVSAVFRPVSAPPNIPMQEGRGAHYLATGELTHGQFGLYRWDMSEQPGGPGPHFHRTISESFFILEGAVRIFNGEQWFDTKPGDFVYVPEGGIHGFRNESGARASMLILFAPGAPREGYFEGLAGLADMSETERLEFFIRHDNYWV